MVERTASFKALASKVLGWSLVETGSVFVLLAFAPPFNPLLVLGGGVLTVNGVYFIRAMDKGEGT